ncbi:MAG: hypothetical protein Q9183_004738 [Haloplaca sp. 2 TL-2023]
MVDGQVDIGDAAGPPPNSPTAAAASLGQEVTYIIAPGYMVVSTRSGQEAIVTATPPSGYTGPLTNTFMLPTAAIELPSISPAPVQSSTASPSSIPTVTPSGGLSTAELAAAIVVPLVLLAILSPIIIVWCLGRRRRRRASKRTSGQKSLIEGHHGTQGTSRHRTDRLSSKPPQSRPKKPHRIVPLPTPTFSSFNFGFSRPASAGPLASPRQWSTKRPVALNRRSATFSWGAPPPYASPTRTNFSSTPIPRLNTPEFLGSPLLETAQMVHIRPVSGQQHRLTGSNTNSSSQGAAPRSHMSLPLSRPFSHDYHRDRTPSTMLQPPEAGRTRQGSAESTAESLHHRSTLQRPFSFQGLPSPTFSDVSGISFDPTLWASTTYGGDASISPIEEDESSEQLRPHHIV